jgi:hypothetical protein
MIQPKPGQGRFTAERVANPAKNLPSYCPLMSIFGNVAEIAAERMEELAGGASLRDAGTTAGIATDKLLALLGEAGGGVPVQINLQVNAQALHERYADMVRKLEETGPQGSPGNCDAG